MVRIERVYIYTKRSRTAGEYVVLVDRLWPRGIRKADLDIDEWPKHLGPSDELRKWFSHREERWDGFVEKYRKELFEDSDKNNDLLRLKQRTRSGGVTLLYSAKNEQFNQARALKEFLEQL